MEMKKKNRFLGHQSTGLAGFPQPEKKKKNTEGFTLTVLLWSLKSLGLSCIHLPMGEIVATWIKLQFYKQRAAF